MFKDYTWYPIDEYRKAYDYRSGWPYVMIAGEAGVPAIARWQPKKPDQYEPWFGDKEPGEPAGWYDCMARRSYVLNPTRFMVMSLFL